MSLISLTDPWGAGGALGWVVPGNPKLRGFPVARLPGKSGVLVAVDGAGGFVGAVEDDEEF